MTPPGRVLVTGAAGFLGRHLVPVLVQAGHEVTALDIRPMPHYASQPGIRAQVVEEEDEDALREAVADADAICHLAALVPRNMQDASQAAECLRVNGLFTLRLAQLALEHEVRRFVCCSSGQVYRYSPSPVTEDAPIYPAERATWYLASKLVGELYVEHLRMQSGLPAVTLRLANLYGPQADDPSVVRRFMQAAMEGRPMEVWDNGVPEYDWVFAPDIAGLIAKALAGGDPGIYNAGTGRPASVLDLAQAVANTFPDRKTEILVKAPTGPIPTGFSALDSGKAAATWHYAPKPLPEALQIYRRSLEAVL